LSTTDQIATTAFVLANVANFAHGSVDTSDIISTSSTTDVLMTGMSKSPVPGTYWSFGFNTVLFRYGGALVLQLMQLLI
jgi:hypothetical protein